MIILGTILILAFAATIAWGALTETMACDMYYSEPQALAKATQHVLGIRVKTGHRPRIKVLNGALSMTAKELYSSDLNTRSVGVKKVSSGISAARRPACKLALHVEPRFATIARARSTARAIGIRLRPTNQAMRKAYMRKVNALGLDFAAARELDLMLA